jgi:hypothetical protein
MIVTVADGIEAPVESVSVPDNPVLPPACANSAAGRTDKPMSTTAKAADETDRIIFPPPIASLSG